MSYCRTSQPDSDLYVIGTGDGWECLGCPLAERETFIRDGKELSMPGSEFFDDLEELWQHLQEHLDAGHKVPQSALDRVLCEMEGEVYLEPDVLLWLLCERLSAPSFVIHHMARAQSIIDALDELADHDAWYESEEWNQP